MYKEVRNGNALSLFFKREKRHAQSVPTQVSETAKAVPVVVLMAMSPMNATPQEALAQLNDRNTIEMYSQLPQIEAPNALDVAQVPQKPKIGIYSAEIVMRHKEFEVDGKKYTIFYNSPIENHKTHNYVDYVSILPNNYTEYELELCDLTGQLKISKLTYHNLGDPKNKDYCTVTLDELHYAGLHNPKRTEKIEFRLPDEIANDVLKFLAEADDIKPTTLLKSRIKVEEVYE